MDAAENNTLMIISQLEMVLVYLDFILLRLFRVLTLTVLASCDATQFPQPCQLSNCELLICLRSNILLGFSPFLSRFRFCYTPYFETLSTPLGLVYTPVCWYSQPCVIDLNDDTMDYIVSFVPNEEGTTIPHRIFQRFSIRRFGM